MFGRSLLCRSIKLFSIDDISDYDRELLKEGAIVRWIIGYERLRSGTVRKVSELYFRRLPAHTKAEYEKAYRKAEALVDGIDWESEAET